MILQRWTRQLGRVRLTHADAQRDNDKRGVHPPGEPAMPSASTRGCDRLLTQVPMHRHAMDIHAAQGPSMFRRRKAQGEGGARSPKARVQEDV